MKLADLSYGAMSRLLQLEGNVRDAQAAARDAADMEAHCRTAMHTRIEADDIARLEQDLPRLMQQAKSAADRYHSLSATVEKCRKWIDSLPAGTTFTDAVMGEPPENLEEKLRETRKQIAAAINEKSALERIATPSADIEARVKAHVAELAQRARPYVRGVSGGKLSVRWPPRPDSSVAGSIDWTQDTANPLMLTALLLPDQLAEVILVEIEREANKDLTVAQREARIEELNIVIEELQRRASDLVFHLVRAGHEETFHQAPAEAVLGVVAHAPKEAAA